jgi:hypothetical protein
LSIQAGCIYGIGLLPRWCGGNVEIRAEANLQIQTNREVYDHLKKLRGWYHGSHIDVAIRSKAGIDQLAQRKALHLVVVDSSPTVGAFLYYFPRDDIGTLSCESVSFGEQAPTPSFHVISRSALNAQATLYEYEIFKVEVAASTAALRVRGVAPFPA